MTENKNNKNKEVHVLDVRPAASIENVSVEAIELTKNLGKPVEFNFNGVVLNVNSESLPEKIYEEYKNGLKTKGEAYRNSPEGKLAAKKYEESILKDQKFLDKLVEQLPDFIKKGDDYVVQWLGAAVPFIENMTIKKDKSAIIDQLKKAGYQKNAFVEDKEVVEGTNKYKYARYFVGQVIETLYPRLTCRYAEEYKNLFPSEQTRQALRDIENIRRSVETEKQ